MVALAADQGEIFVAAGLLEDDSGELLFGGSELLAGLHALGLEQALFDQLRLAGLNGEVGLGKGNLLFPRVAILRNEVAGVAGEHDVVDLTAGAGADLDHFVDVNKMVGHRMT